jgi:3-phytase
MRATRRDAADDPAIWRDARHPERSLIVATDKQAGLNVYNLQGKLLSSFHAGRVNNVDLRIWRGRVIVAASDRNDVAHAKLALFELDTRTARLSELGRFDAGAGEGYGLCLYQRRGSLSAFVVDKDGAIRQLAISANGSGVRTGIVRTMKLATQSEGCVADDRTGNLFVAEEDVGIWRFDADPEGSVTPTRIASDDGVRLVADAEGLAIAAQGRRGGYLVASSQGDSAYAVWRLSDFSYAGRFRIAPGATIDGTSDTDGIEIATASFGAGLSGGIMIAQDGDNAPEAQNFKIVRWADVRKALGLQ